MADNKEKYALVGSPSFNMWHAQKRRKKRKGGGDTPVTQRTFIDLDEVLNSYYLLDAPYTLTGDLTLSYVRGASGSEVDFVNGFGITAGGLFKAPLSVTDIILNGVSVGLGAAAPEDGKINTVVFVGAVSESITYIGADGIGGGFFESIIFDVNLGGVQTFKLDQATGNTENSAEGNNSLTYMNIPESNRALYTQQDNGDWLGENIWELLATNWIDNGDGSYTLGASGSAIFGVVSELKANSNYNVSATYAMGILNLKARIDGNIEVFWDYLATPAPDEEITVLIPSSSASQLRFFSDLITPDPTYTVKNLKIERLLQQP